MDIKIVADSSADITDFEGIPFAAAPLKIITDNKEYIDNATLDVEEMVNMLNHYSGKSSTACPSPGDWLQAFGNAKEIFCITITSGLSGSHNAACIAKAMYEEAHPERRVFVIDSLSAGPELKLIIEKLREYILCKKNFDEICELITEYKKSTGLLFILESMHNLANNGRVIPLVAKAAGLLGIRAVGRASRKGTLELLEKGRGEKKALHAILKHLKKEGANGKVRISHCLNESTALKLKELIVSELANVQVEIYKTRGLCSFYAEKGGLLIGYEC